MYRLAIFDLDGTLIDSVADLAHAINHGLSKLGYPTHPVDAFYQFVGDGVYVLCQRALPKDATEEDVARLHALFQTYYQQHCIDATRPYPGIETVLAQFSDRDIQMAVASNKPQAFTEQIVRHFFGTDRFDLILGNVPDRPRKPAPEIITEILNRLSIERQDAVMIGDSQVDIATAQNAKISSIGCIWGFRGEAELQRAGATHLAKAPKDILSIFNILENT